MHDPDLQPGAAVIMRLMIWYLLLKGVEEPNLKLVRECVQEKCNESKLCHRGVELSEMDAMKRRMYYKLKKYYLLSIAK